MNRYFPNIREHSGDLYIADYSQHTSNAKKVRISETPFSDIACFSVYNPTGHRFRSVNFEENCLYDDKGKKIKSCECMCASVDTKGWVCFIELKYCLKKNRNANAREAYVQLKSTHDNLQAKGRLQGRSRIYLIFSIPESSETPFENFIFPPAELQEMRRDFGYIVRGVNQMHIENNTMLRM